MHEGEKLDVDLYFKIVHELEQNYNNKSGYIHLSLHALTAQGTILFFDCSPAKQIFQQFIIVQQSTSYRWVGMPTKLKLKSDTSKVVDNILKKFKGLILFHFKMMEYAIYLFIDKHSWCRAQLLLYTM